MISLNPSLLIIIKFCLYPVPTKTSMLSCHICYNLQSFVYKFHFKKEVLMKPFKMDASYFCAFFGEGERFINPSVSEQFILQPVKQYFMEASLSNPCSNRNEQTALRLQTRWRSNQPLIPVLLKAHRLFLRIPLRE